MNLVHCPACSKPVSPEANSCPGCGQPLRRDKRLKYAIKLVVAIVVALLAVWFLYACFCEGNSSAQGPIHIIGADGK